MALISSGFMLLPYAGIFPLPLLIASLKSSSLIFFTSSEAKSFTFIALPVGVSPLPSTPWHAAHFCLYNDALFSSAFAGAQHIVATTSKPIPGMTLVVQFLRMKYLSSLAESKHAPWLRHATRKRNAWKVSRDYPENSAAQKYPALRPQSGLRGSRNNPNMLCQSNARQTDNPLHRTDEATESSAGQLPD